MSQLVNMSVLKRTFKNQLRIMQRGIQLWNNIQKTQEFEKMEMISNQHLNVQYKYHFVNFFRIKTGTFIS